MNWTATAAMVVAVAALAVAGLSVWYATRVATVRRGLVAGRRRGYSGSSEAADVPPPAKTGCSLLPAPSPPVFDVPPDYAGPTVRCPQCSTSIGPVIAPAGVSVTLRCGCGHLLEGVVGGDMDSVIRVVIDIRGGSPPIVHVERLGDERVLDVVRTFGKVEIRETPRGDAPCCRG